MRKEIKRESIKHTVLTLITSPVIMSILIIVIMIMMIMIR